ncbi:unnamed protein product [Heligmosomoides polygyrus]|uniref:CCHC-type domain-containing protein n=1 Tax=Heligmosomoides polygyrus TaxID=6339 RepID=A0A183FXZ8_HELPZ|nr:unnamed protein product [Heligmosomoides polygyrus]
MESHPTLAETRVVVQGRQDRVVERVDQDRVVVPVCRDQGSKRSPERVVELMPGPGNREEFGSMEHGKASHRQGEDAIRQRIEFLQSLVDRMENDIRNFPHRKREYLSPYMGRMVRCMFCKVVGEHYSDSCPVVTDGDERFNIVLDENKCQYCLEGCNPDKECPYKKKECLYCKRVKGTAFESLIPNDNGHHNTLCNIPNKRHVARARLNDAKDELRELFRELSRITAAGRNNTNRLDELPAQNGREN